MVVELDQEIDGSVLNILQSLKGILKVTYTVQGENEHGVYIIAGDP